MVRDGKWWRQAKERTMNSCFILRSLEVLSCGVCTTPPSRHKNWGGRTLKDTPITLLRTASIACPWPSQNQSIFSNFQNVEILCNIYMTIIQTKSKKHFPFSKNLPMRQNGVSRTRWQNSCHCLYKTSLEQDQVSQHSNAGGGDSRVPPPNWGAIDNWWILWEGESVSLRLWS